MTTNIQLAKQVASRVQLSSITLRRALIESDLDASSLPEKLALVQQHRCEFSRESVEGVESVKVFVDFQFSARLPSEESSEQDLVKLEATFLLVYSIADSSGIEDRCFRHFSEVNGPYNAWPYWRELVQSATGRVGLSGITVPVFHPTSKEVGEAEDCGDGLP